MRRLTALVILAAFGAAFFISGVALAQGASSIPLGGPTRTVISALPGSPTSVFVYIVTDATGQADCTTGGGSSRTICVWNGSAWEQPSGASGSEVNNLEASAPPTVADDEIFLGSGAGAGAFVAIPDCDASTAEQLQYDTTTNTFSCATGSGGGSLTPDSVGTAELDDDADTPGSGDFVRVDATDQAGFEYRTPAETLSDIGAQPADADLDDLADGSIDASKVSGLVAQLQEDGAQEVLVEALGTGCPNGQVPASDGAGGLGCVVNGSGGPGSDTTAIHEDTAGEISAVTEKATPVAADLILIEDSEDSNNKKRVQIGNLPGGGSPSYPVNDSVWQLQDEGDNTKRLAFDLSNLQTGETVTFDVTDFDSALVFNVMSPPAGSGITDVPEANGQIYDGPKNASNALDGNDGGRDNGTNPGTSNDDAPEINAAIAYACANGFDVVYVPEGDYRIGDATISGFYSGVVIDAATCPKGVRLIGAGMDRTRFLVNGRAGMQLLTITDDWDTASSLQRVCANCFAGSPTVEGFTTASPPVIDFTGDTNLADGDLVRVDRCVGNPEANGDIYRLQNGSGTPNFTFELVTPEGDAVDVSNWGTWTSGCAVNIYHRDFRVEVAGIGFIDDNPYAHVQWDNSGTGGVINETGLEESHGLLINQSGGFVDVHDCAFLSIFDEALEVSAWGANAWIHDNYFDNNRTAAIGLYKYEGVVIERNVMDATEPSLNDKLDDGTGNGWDSTATLFAKKYQFGVQGDPGAQNWEMVNTVIRDNVIRGGIQTGIEMGTNASGSLGHRITGTYIANNLLEMTTRAGHCDEAGEPCLAIDIGAAGGFPMEDIVIEGNRMLGGFRSDGDDVINLTVVNNTIQPRPEFNTAAAVFLQGQRIRFSGNSVSGFNGNCIETGTYETNGGSNGTTSIEISSNKLVCPGAATNVAIREFSGDSAVPAADDPGYYRILNNEILFESDSLIDQGILISFNRKGVQIIGNKIQWDAALTPGGEGIYVLDVEEPVIAENEIIGQTNAILSYRSDGALIRGNKLDGLGVSDNGIHVRDSSHVRVIQNTVDDFAGNPIYYQDNVSPADEGIVIASNVIRNPGTNDHINVVCGGSCDDAAPYVQGVVVADNIIEMNAVGGDAVKFSDIQFSSVAGNIMLDGPGDAFEAIGDSDFLSVFNNVTTDDALFRHGSAGGDGTCTATGAGANSLCGNNIVQ